MATTCKLIAKTTLGSNAATATFTSIPGTYTDLLLVGSARSTRNLAIENFTIRFNGAADDSNLSARLLSGNGANADSSSLSRGALGNLTGATATANTFASFEVYIPNYAGSTNKSYSATAVTEDNSSTAYMSAVAGLWSSTSAITQIEIRCYTAEDLVSGSSFYLYGITKA